MAAMLVKKSFYFYTAKSEMEEREDKNDEDLASHIAAIFFIISDGGKKNLFVELTKTEFKKDSVNSRGNLNGAFRRKLLNILSYIDRNIEGVKNCDFYISGDENRYKYIKDDNTLGDNGIKYKNIAKDIIKYYKNNVTVNQETKRYIKSLFEKYYTKDDILKLNEKNEKNELYEYNNNTLSLYNITTRYFDETGFFAKLKTNNLFKKYIIFIVDVLMILTGKNIPSAVGIHAFMLNLNLKLTHCTKVVYNGILNNLSVCDVLTKINLESLIKVQETFNKIDDDASQQINKYIHSDVNHIEPTVEQATNENFQSPEVETESPNETETPIKTESPIEIIFKEDDFFQNEKLINLLKNYDSPATEQYVDTIIGEKRGFLNTHLSRIYRPGTWTFTRRLGARMGLKGGRRRRTRRSKARTKRRVSRK